MLNQVIVASLITCLVSSVLVQVSSGPVEDKYSCPHGWTRYGSKKCLKYVNELQDYERAQATCRLKNQGTLVTVHTAEEQNFVYSYIHSIAASSTPIWLGAKQIDFESILWLDKTENSYTNWSPSEPSHPDEICIAINPRTGQWQDVMCTEAFVPACERAPTTQWPFFVAFCSEGWFQYNDEKCIRIISSQALNFYESQELCRSKYNSKLLSIKADKESEFVHNLIKFRDVKVPVWLGAVQNDFSSFNWIDKSDVTFTNWAEGEPNDPDHACISMVASGGKWSDNDCKEQKLILCQKAVPEEGACETGWLQFRQDKCYRFVHIRLALDDAESLCNNLYGGHLPSIHSQEEQFMITQFLASVNVKNGSEIWLGGRQMDFHNYNWGDGSPFNYSYWEQGEPSFPAEKCIEMSWRNGRWNDINCRLKRAVLCERHMASRHAINKPIHYQPTTCLDSNCTSGSSGVAASTVILHASNNQHSPASDLSVASALAEPREPDHFRNSDGLNASASSVPEQVLLSDEKPIKVIASIMNREQQFMAPANDLELQHHGSPNATGVHHPPLESNTTSIHYSPSAPERMLAVPDTVHQQIQNSSSQSLSARRESSVQMASTESSKKEQRPSTASQEDVNQFTLAQQEGQTTVSLLDKVKTQPVLGVATTLGSLINQSTMAYNTNTTSLSAPKQTETPVVGHAAVVPEKLNVTGPQVTASNIVEEIGFKAPIQAESNLTTNQEFVQITSLGTMSGQQREKIIPTDNQALSLGASSP